MKRSELEFAIYSPSESHIISKDLASLFTREVTADQDPLHKVFVGRVVLMETFTCSLSQDVASKKWLPNWSGSIFETNNF